MLNLTLTVIAILSVAILAHFSGASRVEQRGTIVRVLDSRGIVVAVAAITFVTLWYSWASWDPIPVVHDEMAYVLQAEIFARGRWSLPSPPIPAFWEQTHVLVEPALGAKYFPGHALAMAVGALVGWPALMPLLLQGVVAALLFVLARRLASGAVAFLAWVIWLTTPMVLYFGASYFSQSTTTVCWLSGWYALLQWRETRRLRWLLLVAFFTGWDAISRPLTGVAYAIPVGIVVMYDVIRLRHWRQLGYALLVGSAVLAILPLWSAGTTGDWRVTPLTLYTRLYMPYDLPGFGLDSTPPLREITPELRQLNNVYSSLHPEHTVSRLPKILAARAQYLSISIWGVTSGVVSVFAMLGLLTLTSASAFAVASGVVLLLCYLVFATPPQWTLYYYESVPAYAFLSASGLALAASFIGRPRGEPVGPAFGWRSPRWSRALVSGACILALPGAVALQVIHGQHIGDRKFLTRFDHLLASIHDERAIVFVRYAGTHNPHVTFVRNTANPEQERIWVVYDRGEIENARLLALAPERTAYLFDEIRGRTYLYDPNEQP